MTSNNEHPLIVIKIGGMLGVENLVKSDESRNFFDSVNFRNSQIHLKKDHEVEQK
jgi:hypothetical protein